MRTVFALAPHFPSPDESADGQGNYLNQIIAAVGRSSELQVDILALRFGAQTAEESGPGWRVQRVEPSTSMDSVFDLYLPEHLGPALDTLTQAAVEAGQSLEPGTPVWCHGYETGAAAEALATQGHWVVGVPHYLVGVETLHDLALGDDPIRRTAFDSPWATLLGQLTPRSTRPMGVRWASRMGGLGQHLPLPSAIRTQFRKLDLERRLVANASRLVAVGPGFESEMNALYPCTMGRSSHTIAGAPTQLPPAQWPHENDPSRLRIIMVGRPTGQKGWDYAAAAFAALTPAERNRIDLCIVGGLGQWTGPYSAYSESVAAQFKALEQIRFSNLGPLSHPETLAYLMGAQLLLFPSVFEPLGLVLLEAMAAGCSVLASDAAGPIDVLQAPWGTTVPFGEPSLRVQALRDGLRAVLSRTPEQLIEMEQMARSAATQFSWSQAADHHLRILFEAN